MSFCRCLLPLSLYTIPFLSKKVKKRDLHHFFRYVTCVTPLSSTPTKCLRPVSYLRQTWGIFFLDREPYNGTILNPFQNYRHTFVYYICLCMLASFIQNIIIWQRYKMKTVKCDKVFFEFPSFDIGKRQIWHAGKKDIFRAFDRVFDRGKRCVFDLNTSS